MLKKPQPKPSHVRLAKELGKSSPALGRTMLIVGGIVVLFIIIYFISQAGRNSSGYESGSTSNSTNTTNTATTNTYTPTTTTAPMTPSNTNMSSSSNTNSSSSTVSFYPYTGGLTSLLPKTVGAFTLNDTDTSPDEEFKKTLDASEMIDSVYATSGGRAVHL